MKGTYWKYTGIGLICLFLYNTCGGCEDDEKQSSEYSSNDGEDYSWLNGTWVCNTQYGSIVIEIDGNHIRENYRGEQVFSGTFSIHDDAIYPNGNSTFYPLETSTHRIGDGLGGYFTKR